MTEPAEESEKGPPAGAGLACSWLPAYLIARLVKWCRTWLTAWVFKAALTVPTGAATTQKYYNCKQKQIVDRFHHRDLSHVRAHAFFRLFGDYIGVLSQYLRTF